MSILATTEPDRRRVLFEYLSLVGAELLLVALAWFSMDALAHLRLSVTAFLQTYVVWGLPLILSTLWGMRRCERRSWLIPLEATGSVVVLALLNYRLRHPLSFAQIAYGGGLTMAFRLLWRTWRIPIDVDYLPEIARRLLLTLLALIVVFPFFTDLGVGGVDARWYRAMLADFIQQARSGVFPVFIGQGEFAYNGAVHPFRSAPVYLWLAGAWDLVTFRSLSALALQHLTAISAGLVMVWSCYLAFVELAKGQRWIAAAFAALYITCPGVLAPLFRADMYMTWMASAALPFLIYANARTLADDDDPFAWPVLAAAIALIWMCHPPTALQASLATLAIQVSGMMHKGFSAKKLSHWIQAGIWFVALAGYYFYSMTELPEPPSSLGQDIIFFLAIALVVAAAIGGIARAKWPWLLLLVPGTVIIFKLQKPWLWWELFFVGLLLIAVLLNRWIKKTYTPSQGVIFIAITTFVAGGLAWFANGHKSPAYSFDSMQRLSSYASHLERFFLPLSTDLSSVWDFQPGVVLWIALALSLWGGLLNNSFRTALFAVGAVFFSLLLVRIPAVSDFFVGYTPIVTMGVTSLPLGNRIAPLIGAFACGAGFFAFASFRYKRRWLAKASAIALAVGVFWSAWQARRFLQRGIAITDSRELTAARARSENTMLERFAYDLVSIPVTFSNGVTDPLLSGRIREEDGTPRGGLDAVAETMEKADAREINVVCHEGGAAKGWWKFSPEITVEPGDHLFLRFSFRTDKNYAGYLIFSSTKGDYREYHLPASGLSSAFGSEEWNSKLVSLWNTTDTVSRYDISQLREPSNDFVDGEEFAKVVISHYAAERASVAVESFLPYRAKVSMTTEGFFETPRVFLPGYRVKADSLQVPAESSQDHLLQVHLPPGLHQVDVEFVGTGKLRLAFWISGASWLVFLFSVLLRLPRRKETQNAAV